MYSSNIWHNFRCWSDVGWKSANLLEMSLGPMCVENNIVQHELLHSVGLYHEHSRWDRDKYVRVFFDRMGTKEEKNQYKKVRFYSKLRQKDKENAAPTI